MITDDSVNSQSAEMALLTKMVLVKWESKFVRASFEFVVVFKASSVQFLASERFPSSLWHYSTTTSSLFTLISKLLRNILSSAQLYSGAVSKNKSRLLMWSLNFKPPRDKCTLRKSPWKWTQQNSKPQTQSAFFRLYWCMEYQVLSLKIEIFLKYISWVTLAMHSRTVLETPGLSSSACKTGWTDRTFGLQEMCKKCV